jgi:pyruvate dehydrogenase E2 component (dihydrolipoamide acetyltransferase)
MLEFKLPEIGEGVVEGEIVRWHKQPGDFVHANEALVEVMTDKATIEVPSPISGTLQEIRAQVGDICAVEQVIAILDPVRLSRRHKSIVPWPRPPHGRERGTAVERSRPGDARRPRPCPRIRHRPALAAGRRARKDHQGRRVLRAQGRQARGAESCPQSQVPWASRPRLARPRPLAAPASASLQPSQSARHRRRSPRRPVATVAGDEEIPFRGMRRRIAEGMVRSYTTAVHYTYVEQVNVTRLVKLRADAKAVAAEQGVKH